MTEVIVSYPERIKGSVNDPASVQCVTVGELIRCKDCQHIRSDKDIPGLKYCLIHDLGWIYPNYYCADGVKKK